MARRQSFAPISGDRRNDVQLPVSADELPDSVSVDLDDKDPDNFVILEEDDTPEEDRGRPTSYTPEDEELAGEVEDLRGRRRDPASRVKRLTFERETERRRAEQAEREREAAIELARTTTAENEDLRQRLQRGNSALAENMLARNGADIQTAKAKLAKAHEDGDATAMADAQVEISRLTAEEVAIKTRAPRQPDPNNPPPPQQPQRQQPAPQLAPKVAAWIGRNAWFGKDKAKTEFAMGIHRSLEAEGVVPTDDRYTQELDRRMKAVYNDHTSSEDDDTSRRSEDRREQQRDARRPNANAGGAREAAPPGGPRTVTLTRSELSIAKRLGVTPQAYARSKMERDGRLGNGDGA